MAVPKAIKDYFAKMGKKGGSARTEAQTIARRANGAKGGRPRKKPAKTADLTLAGNA